MTSDQRSAGVGSSKAITIHVAGVVAGGLAGVLIPSWSAHYQHESAVLLTSLSLLGLQALTIQTVAVILKRWLVGLVLVVLSAGAAVVLFLTTWFTITPGMISALWAMTAAVIFWRNQPLVFRRLMTIGSVILLAATVSSLQFFGLLVGPLAQLAGSTLNGAATLGVACFAFITLKKRFHPVV